METVVSIVKDKFNWSRVKTCVVVIIGCFILGIPSSLGNGPLSDVSFMGLGILDMFDFISNSVLMPIVAFLTCVFIGYIIKPGILIDEIELNGKFKSKKLFNVMIKYIAPVFIVLILVSSILDVFKIVVI